MKKYYLFSMLSYILLTLAVLFRFGIYKEVLSSVCLILGCVAGIYRDRERRAVGEILTVWSWVIPISYIAALILIVHFIFNN